MLSSLRVQAYANEGDTDNCFGPSESLAPKLLTEPLFLWSTCETPEAPRLLSAAGGAPAPERPCGARRLPAASTGLTEPGAVTGWHLRGFMRG